jgi:hypothetical protein
MIAIPRRLVRKDAARSGYYGGQQRESLVCIPDVSGAGREKLALYLVE